jgi:hypothetical protein
MNEQQNIHSVQNLYECFQRGDIPTLLNGLSEDVRWETHAPAEILPWAGVKNGRSEVGEFFSKLGGEIEFTAFEPTEYIADGDRVVVRGSFSAKVRSNGNAIDDQQWVMLWTLHNNLATHYDYFDDTSRVINAYVGSLVTSGAKAVN